jgi:hypothetical protein
MGGAELAGAIFAFFAAMIGAELLKAKLINWISPPPEPIFSKEEKKLFYGMKHKLDALPTEVLTLTTEEHEALMELHKIHDNTDQDGIPLWYVPRSWQKTQEETLKVTQEIAYAQKETAKALEGVTKVIERLADKISG